METINIPPEDSIYIDSLRSLIRTGVTAAPSLEESPLVDLPVVRKYSGSKASAAKRAHTFIQVLQLIVRQRLEGKEAQTASMLFGLGDYAGVPVQDRYRAVAKLYNSYWTWENYRKEPLTRHLLAIYLLLRREAVLSTSLPTGNQEAHTLHEATGAHASDRVLIIQNITREGPGLLERLLREVAISYDVVDLSEGEIFPDPTQYGAIIVLGGPDSANDKTAKMQLELQRIKEAFDAGVPFLGICLGLQVAAKVMGGSVIKSPVKEVGLRSPSGAPYSVSLTELALTALGRKDPLFVGLQNDFRVFQLHGETITLTKQMQLLATGQDCRNQIVKFRRNAYGIQSHFELTKDMLVEWLDADPDLTPLDAQKVLADFDEISELYTITGLSLLRNFLHIAGLLA